MRFALLALFVLLAAASLATATDPYRYRQSYSYPSTYYQKVYVAESVLVPVVVPSALLVNLSPTASPPPVTIAPAALTEAQGQTAAVLARMEAMERKLDQLLAPQMPRADQAVPAGALALQAPSRPTLAEAAAVAKMACAQCHTGPSARAGVRLFNDKGEYEPNLPPAAIAAAVRNDRMPMGPAKLSPEHKALLAAFAR
jgi:mono/diheme cytochrome c family protein